MEERPGNQRFGSKLTVLFLGEIIVSLVEMARKHLVNLSSKTYIFKDKMTKH